MEILTVVSGSHSLASPCGRYIASLSNSKLRICSSYAPERCTDVNIRPVKDVLALRWSEDSTRVAVVTAQHVEVTTLDDAGHKIRLDNGSGGLGRFISADFIGPDQLLVIWEFGKAKLWNLSDGKGVELVDVKATGTGGGWQIRPGSSNQSARTLAMLSRAASDDVLSIYFAAQQRQLSSTKMLTIDAQSLSWSPDGRWLAVRDTPTASSSLHVFTPDGHLFRTYPSLAEIDANSFGIKSAVWSGNSQLLALTQHDGRIVLLNTRTFAPMAIIEHTTTIDQRTLSPDTQAPIWQESVSATGARSYSRIAQPVSPPLSRTKSSFEPSELGVAEARFSCDGTYLATRDERMLNTVWIWSMSTLAAYAVLIQHSNVRCLRWHPTRSDLLLLDSSEGIVYLFNASISSQPLLVSTSLSGLPALSWLHTAAGSKPMIQATTRSSFQVVYPESRPEDDELTNSEAAAPAGRNDAYDEGASDDSLFDVLSGRKPLPPKTEPSYTEMVDFELGTEEEDMTATIDDTFREKKTKRRTPLDPLDDSEIF